ncbi:hormone-sensitive lipase-like protein [Dinothrombium tinctorium]|uniref:Hormone-sensitive lipase-like protein n=1 Tax=Dinothrombium tinctorium TaxID=1965070 RepID=A0A443RCX2_9ACAR|nr:hormone-sensitive lipase-like protein [Dinothrombium tinctorium]
MVKLLRIRSLQAVGISCAINFFHTYYAMNEELLSSLYAENGFWLSTEEQAAAKYAMINSLTTANLYIKLRAFLDRFYRGCIFAHLLKSGLPLFASKGHSIRELFTNKSLFASYQNEPVSLHEVFVPRQERWLISPFDAKIGPTKNLDYICEVRAGNISIKCTLYRRKNVAMHKNNSMIIYCSAGFNAFSQEYIYLSKLVNDVPGLVVLSIDYSTMQSQLKYPTATQILLDVYLHCMSQKENRNSTIGFNPQKIVVLGNCLGSLLSVHLCLCINDIRRKGFKVQMPASIICINPYFPFPLSMTPSLVSSAFNVLLTPSNILHLFSEYLPKPPNIGNTASTVNVFSISNGHSKYLFVEKFTDNEIASPWFENGECNFESEYLKYEAIISNAYVSPIEYDYFESLSTISLNLITAENNPFLDTSIELAKMWRGEFSDMLCVCSDIHEGS